jgi:hypothetical protein
LEHSFHDHQQHKMINGHSKIDEGFARARVRRSSRGPDGRVVPETSMPHGYG